MNTIEIDGTTYEYFTCPFDPGRQLHVEVKLFYQDSGIYFGALKYEFLLRNSLFWYRDNLHTATIVENAQIPFDALYKFLRRGRWINQIGKEEEGPESEAKREVVEYYGEQAALAQGYPEDLDG